MLKILNSFKEKRGFLKDSVMIFLNHEYFSPFILLENLKQEFAWCASSLRFTLVWESTRAGPPTLFLSNKNERRGGKRGITVLHQDESWAAECLCTSLPSVSASTMGFIHQQWKTENSCFNAVLTICFFTLTMSVKFIAMQAKKKRKNATLFLLNLPNFNFFSLNVQSFSLAMIVRKK